MVSIYLIECSVLNLRIHILKDLIDNVYKATLYHSKISDRILKKTKLILLTVHSKCKVNSCRIGKKSFKNRNTSDMLVLSISVFANINNQLLRLQKLTKHCWQKAWQNPRLLAKSVYLVSAIYDGLVPILLPARFADDHRRITCVICWGGIRMRYIISIEKF